MIEKIIRHVFAPIKARYRLLLLFPLLNVLFLSIVLLFLKAPKEAILLSMGTISFVVFLIATKKFASLFYYSSLLFNILIFIMTFSNESIWTKGWSLSMILSLILGYHLSLEVMDFYHNDEKASLEDQKERALWKQRFETLRDSHNLEALGVEEQLETAKESLKEKNGQIRALERLIEVTHKEAAILSKQKHELLDKLKCDQDRRCDEEVKRENLSLVKKLDALKLLEREFQALQGEKSLYLDKISLLQETNRLLEQQDQTKKIEQLQEEIQRLQDEKGKEGTLGMYSKGQIYQTLEELNFFKNQHEDLQKVLCELKEKLEEPSKLFKWQVWKGEKKEKKVDTKKTISMLDLGKGLKI
jgi:hypothetical protein